MKKEAKNKPKISPTWLNSDLKKRIEEKALKEKRSQLTILNRLVSKALHIEDMREPEAVN